MSDTGHDLHSEFPNDGAILHQLKLDDAHFQTLSLRHHDLTKAIMRIENGLEPASDERLEEMKKQRLALLDDIAMVINAHRVKS